MIAPGDIIEIWTIEPPVTIVQHLRALRIWSKENPAKGLASGSEIKRWCKAGNVILDGVAVDENHVITFPIISLVLFPKGQRNTLF